MQTATFSRTPRLHMYLMVMTIPICWSLQYWMPHECILKLPQVWQVVYPLSFIHNNALHSRCPSSSRWADVVEQQLLTAWSNSCYCNLRVYWSTSSCPVRTFGGRICPIELQQCQVLIVCMLPAWCIGNTDLSMPWRSIPTRLHTGCWTTVLQLQNDKMDQCT